MKSKLILSVLALSLLPGQLCAMFGSGQQTIKMQLDVSEDFADKLTNVFKKMGERINNDLNPSISSFGQTTGDALSDIGSGFTNLGTGISHTMRPIVNAVAKYAAISVASGLITAYMRKYIEKYFFEPVLIEKRSSHWMLQPFSLNKQIKLEDHMVISDKLSQDLTYIMKMTKNIKKNGGSFENVLLYGEPGTGKTLFAQLLAQDSGMAYAFVPAANVSKFFTKNTASSAAHELDQLFAWAAGNSNGTILFFDEAETFLAQRSTLSIEAQNALAAFLAKTGTPSNKIMIICATNRPEIMDDAVLSRLGFRVEFPLPDLKAREAQLTMHVDKVFAKQEGKQISYDLLKNPASLTRIAEQLEGCSGRSIQKAVNRLRQTALAEDASEITEHIIQRTVQQVQKDRVKPTVVAHAA